MKNKHLFIVFVFFTIQLLDAHKQHVHQYYVREGYSLLKNQIGDIPAMTSRISTAVGGGGGTWSGLITAGAWNEDEEDAIYKYSKTNPPIIQGGGAYNLIALFGGITPDPFVSVTHFWDADILLIDAGINASSGFSQIKYRTTIWIEDQLTSNRSGYWMDEHTASLIGKSKSKDEIVEKLSTPEKNIRYAAAYIAMMIYRWKKDSLNISRSVDTLATMYASGICSPKRFYGLNIIGRTAQAFYESDRLEEYFSK